jgi:hypothetical protein
MNENNKKEKDELLIPDKTKTKKFNSSIISPKKVATKNNIKNKKGVFQIQKRPKIILEEDNNPQNVKFGHNSPDVKSKTNEINTLKEYQKNMSNNSNQIKIQKQKKFQQCSNNNSTINNINNNNNNNNNEKNPKDDKNEKIKEENKTINNTKIFVNPKKQNINKNNKIEVNNSINISHSHNSKKIKINIINKAKNNRNLKKEKKKKELSIELIKNDNYIDHFTVDECDENTDKNFLNSRKHYSLTNPNILPCIPFSNPFSKNNTIDANHDLDNNTKNEIPQNINKNNINQDLILGNSNDHNNIIENEDEEDIKLNISNLEIDIENINDKAEEEANSSKSENPITNIHQSFNSFIQFNNNLSFKLAAEKTKNTPSYMLALCPKLYMGLNKKKIIKENYAVNDAISEEMDSDTLTPKNSKNKNSIEEKNTKYSTKEKYSDRNKKQNEFESEDGSYEIEKKNTFNNFNNSNSERKNANNQNNNSNSVYNIYKNIFKSKNQKVINKNNYENIINNNENNIDEQTKTIVNKKIDKKKKKLNIKDINIETQNINNINNVSLNTDIKNTLVKINCFLTSPNRSNISCHHNNNGAKVYNETENNKVHSKILKIKNNEYKERHQKAKSLLSNINLSTLHLYETIQNNNNSNINIMGNKKQKLLKNNIKSTDYRNKILNKEKKVIENDANGTNNSIVKKKTNEKILFNENDGTNIYKNDDNKNINLNNNGYNSNNISSKKKLKKTAYSHLLKSPKYRANPFLSNLANNNEKIYNTNNENLYTMHNTENKYSNYYELFKKRNSNYKLNNINNNTINTINSNNELNNNLTNEINMVNHCKKISQQFIDEYNLLLETKSDNNNTVTSGKNKVTNNNNINSNNEIINNNNVNIKKKNSLNKYFSYNAKQKSGSNNKDAPDINKSIKFKIQINKGNNNLTKKISQITPCHKKSRTFFISPSYVIKNINHRNEKTININTNKDNNKKMKENQNYNSNIHQKNTFGTNKIKCHQKKNNINYNANKKTICKNKDKNSGNNQKNDKKKTIFSEIKKVKHF